MASEKNIQIKMKIECNNLTANLDPLRLKQVLYNYLSNAIKFTKKDGLITVAIAADAENMIRIDVKDNGIGIHANDIDKLFIDFQQLQTNYKNRQGTGLGLALTKKIIEAQHGRVEVKSQIGKGSVFSAILPRNILKPEDTHLSDSN